MNEEQTQAEYAAQLLASPPNPAMELLRDEIRLLRSEVKAAEACAVRAEAVVEKAQAMYDALDQHCEISCTPKWCPCSDLGAALHEAGQEGKPDD